MGNNKDKESWDAQKVKSVIECGSPYEKFYHFCANDETS